ncbi:hypothetical protein [Nocardia carnea]|uniref:hypothetical protein n=1 Tax=Nocardia carnea TaxID=37328 RepID=UPI0024569CE7|nr:hypothetical protein [Nocardia carnea]
MNPSNTRQPMLPVVFRAVAGAVGVAAGLLWLCCLWIALPFYLSSDPATDPHGYGLMFGTVFSLPTGLAAALAVPFAVPARHRRRVTRILIPVLVLVTAALWVAFVAAS